MKIRPRRTTIGLDKLVELSAANSRRTAEGEATPWLPDASVTPLSATVCRRSCPTSTRMRRVSGSTHSTRSPVPAAAGGPATSCFACWSGRASSRSECPACVPLTTSTRSRRSGSRGSPATSTSSGASAPTSGGTPRSWCRALTTRAERALAGISRPMPPRRRCMRWGSTTSSAARTTASRVTRSSSRGTPRPGSTRGRSSRGG